MKWLVWICIDVKLAFFRVISDIIIIFKKEILIFLRSNSHQKKRKIIMYTIHSSFVTKSINIILKILMILLHYRKTIYAAFFFHKLPQCLNYILCKIWLPSCAQDATTNWNVGVPNIAQKERPNSAQPLI